MRIIKNKRGNVWISGENWLNQTVYGSCFLPISQVTLQVSHYANRYEYLIWFSRYLILKKTLVNKILMTSSHGFEYYRGHILLLLCCCWEKHCAYYI